jgi:hypothetical protein
LSDWILVIVAMTIPLLRRGIGNSLRRFVGDLREGLSRRGVGLALLHMLVSYVAIAGAFAVLYASLYAFAGPTTFSANSSLGLLDFLYYSLFVPTALGYPDISPQHWLAKVLTLLQFGLGILFFLLYLGMIVSRMSMSTPEGTDGPGHDSGR